MRGQIRGAGVCGSPELGGARRPFVGAVAAILVAAAMATACSGSGSRVSADRTQQPPVAAPPAPITSVATLRPGRGARRKVTPGSAATTAAPSTPTTTPPTTAAPTTAPPTTPAPTTAPPTTPAPTTAPPTTEAGQPGWTPVSYLGGAIAVDEHRITGTDGSEVTVFRFHAGRVRFELHVGSEDPPADLASLPADAQPAVSSAEAPALLAAFNGGFKVNTGAGGVEVDGQTLVALQDGAASFVTDADGAGHVGIWGQTLPAAGEQVVSVRQCLQPLVENSEPSPQISDVAAWGATLGGGSWVARSALGEDTAGNILYAGSMSAVPADLADAFVSSGVTTAMELDINPEWVQLAWAATPGGALQTGVPGQNRPADQYPAGWTRDFVTVLAGA